jgi:hypothetical protein
MSEQRHLPWAWIVIALGDDNNWWVAETSDSTSSEDALSVMEPEQVRYVIESLEPYAPDGYKRDLFEEAFHAWRVESQLADGRLRLAPADDSFFDDTQLFALPDVPLDVREELEEKGNYPDFIDQLEQWRIRHLNRTHDYARPADELDMEDELRAIDQDRYACGMVAHVFDEIREILGWSPAEWSEDEPA